MSDEGQTCNECYNDKMSTIGWFRVTFASDTFSSGGFFRDVLLTINDLRGVLPVLFFRVRGVTFYFLRDDGGFYFGLRVYRGIKVRDGTLFRARGGTVENAISFARRSFNVNSVVGHYRLFS